MDTIKITGKKVPMIAHRGMSGLERENTNAAFVAAGNRSYYGIETDIHKTLDGKYVVIHDESTKRVTNGRIDIVVEKHNYDDVKDLVLPDLDGSLERSDIRIPLLHEYIRICKKYEKVSVLELKNLFAEEDILEIIQIIQQEGYLDRVIFISFVLENCLILRKHLPEQPVQWLIGGEVNEEIKDILYTNHFDLDVYYKQLSEDLIQELHEHKVLVNCWTCDNKEEAEAVITMGVDFITSNILE